MPCKVVVCVTLKGLCLFAVNSAIAAPLESRADYKIEINQFLITLKE